MPLWQSLLLLAGFCALFRAWWPTVAAAALLANWCVCTAASQALGYQFYYMLLAAVDLATAAFLLIMPLSRPQILICLTYVIALCCHAYFAIVGPTPATEYSYWWQLHYIAWSQFWIACIWGMYDTGCRLGGRGDRGRSMDAAGHLHHPLAGVVIHRREDA